jgi:hypothetical protein
MQVKLKASPAISDKASLSMEVVETTITIADCYCGDHWATVTQRLKGPAVTLTRTFDATNERDWAVLKLEAKALGVDLVKERDLHQFAARFRGRHAMTSIIDSAGKTVVVMKKVAAELRGALAAFERNASSGTHAVANGRVVA